MQVSVKLRTFNLIQYLPNSLDLIKETCDKKMKVLVILAISFTTVKTFSSKINQLNLNNKLQIISASKFPEIDLIDKQCRAQYNVNNQDLQDYHDGKNVPKVECYVRCFNLKLKIVNDDNNFNVEKFAAFSLKYIGVYLTERERRLLAHTYAFCKRAYPAENSEQAKCSQFVKVLKCVGSYNSSSKDFQESSEVPLSSFYLNMF